MLLLEIGSKMSDRNHYFLACAVVTLLLISIGMCVFDTNKNNPNNPYNNYGTRTLSKASYHGAPDNHETSGIFNRQKPENVSQKYRNDPRRGLNRFHIDLGLCYVAPGDSH